MVQIQRMTSDLKIQFTTKNSTQVAAKLAVIAVFAEFLLF